jgi:hypothetical protein
MPAVNFFLKSGTVSGIQSITATEYYDKSSRINNKIFGSVFFAWQARHEYSQFSLIRLIISYNLLMFYLNFSR